MDDVDAGDLTQLLQPEVLAAAVAGGAEAELAGIGLGVGQQLPRS